MYHKKVKTQPCLSPESPFMRKPSRQFLKGLKLTKTPKFTSEPTGKENKDSFLSVKDFSKIGFIPTGIQASKDYGLLNCSTNKLKKTTIELSSFKIKHENMILKNQLEQLKNKNAELQQQNQKLLNQNQDLKNQLQNILQNSKISKISNDTKNETFSAFSQSLYGRVQGQILKIDSYNILPLDINVPYQKSFMIDSEEKTNSFAVKQSKNHQTDLSIPFLNCRLQFLQNQLQKTWEKVRFLQSQNFSLSLHASMSKRKFQDKSSQLKQIVMKQRKKKFAQKLFELSSGSED